MKLIGTLFGRWEDVYRTDDYYDYLKRVDELQANRIRYRVKTVGDAARLGMNSLTGRHGALPGRTGSAKETFILYVKEDQAEQARYCISVSS